MKKSMYLVAGLLTIGLGSAFTSCSNDEDINPGMEQVEEGTQVLTLSVANGGDGLQSRAGRPLLSSAADQDIQQVVLYFVQTSEGTNKGKCVLTKWVDWENAVDYADGKQPAGKEHADCSPLSADLFRPDDGKLLLILSAHRTCP